MYHENGGFDQSSGLSQAEDGFSQTHLPNCNNTFSMEEQSQSYPQSAVAAASALEMELQQQQLEMEQCYSNNKNSVAEIQDSSNNWQEMSGFHHQNPQSDFNQIYPDLLNIFPLPRSSLLPNFSQKSPAFLASLGLLGDVSPAEAVYDPLLPLNLPPQPPLLRELFHSLPHGYTPRNGGLFTNAGVDDTDANVGLFQNGDGSLYEFTAAEIGGKNRDGIKDAKHFATEKHRRVLLNDKYQALRALVPTPTKVKILRFIKV